MMIKFIEESRDDMKQTGDEIEEEQLDLREQSNELGKPFSKLK